MVCIVFWSKKYWYMCLICVAVRSVWHSSQLVYYMIMIKIREPLMNINGKVIDVSRILKKKGGACCVAESRFVRNIMFVL